MIDDDFTYEAPAPQCTMMFCTNEGVEMIKAFGNEEERLYCTDHAELAKSNLEAEEMYGSHE